MIERVVIAVAVAACNQFYDVRETSLPPADAAPFCPESGPPPISRRLVQIATGGCFDYSFSEVTRRAVALCYAEGPPFYEVREGPQDSDLEPTVFVLPSVADRIAYPHISADGSEVWVFEILTRRFLVYHRVRDQEWRFDRMVDGVNEGREARIAGLVDGPSGRRLLVELNPGASAMVIVERSDDGSGTWSTVTSRTDLVALDVDFFSLVGVNGDGRRIVFAGERGSSSGLFYAERSDSDVPFSPAVSLPNVPVSYETAYQLNSDCSRLYFSEIDSIFYASQ